MKKFIIFMDEWRSGDCYFKEYELEVEKSLKDVRRWISSDKLVNLVDCLDNVYENNEVYLMLGSLEELKKLDKNKFDDDECKFRKVSKEDNVMIGSFDCNYMFDELKDLFELVIKREEVKEC